MSGETDVLLTADMRKPFGKDERFLRVCCRRGSSLPHSLMTSTGVVYNNDRDVATFSCFPKGFHVSAVDRKRGDAFPRQRRGNLFGTVERFPRVCREMPKGFHVGPAHGDVETFCLWQRRGNLFGQQRRGNLFAEVSTSLTAETWEPFPT